MIPPLLGRKSDTASLCPSVAVRWNVISLWLGRVETGGQVETNLANINFQLKQTGSAFNRFYVMEKLFKFCFYFDFIVMAGFGPSTEGPELWWSSDSRLHTVSARLWAERGSEIVKITPIGGGQFPGRSHAGLWPPCSFGSSLTDRLSRPPTKSSHSILCVYFWENCRCFPLSWPLSARISRFLVGVNSRTLWPREPGRKDQI